MRRGSVLLSVPHVLLVLAAAGCGGDEPTGAGQPALSDPLTVVPFASAISGLRVQAANDSLDVVEHHGRTYLAFRTSASWFTDDDTQVHVVSAEGETRWVHETTFATGEDLRDPRFLSWDARLFLFVGRFGSDQGDPVPLGAIVSELVDGAWTEPQDVLEAGLVVSRARVDDGLAYLVAWGAAGDGRAVYFLTSDDGATWTPVGASGPVVQATGGGDTDVLFRTDGSLLAITTNELGDSLGWGSHVCRAARVDAPWSCTGDPRRFDGPLLFAQGSTEYLVARRNVSDTGAYDLGRDDLAPAVQTQLYRDDYLQRPKRCALWRIAAGDVPELVADFPSRGDTCGASVLRQASARIGVYYHSSPLDGADVTFRIGQAGGSTVHRLVISF